jgi:hypothetical protein
MVAEVMVAMERTHNQSDYKQNSRVLGIATPLPNLVTLSSLMGQLGGFQPPQPVAFGIDSPRRGKRLFAFLVILAQRPPSPGATDEVAIAGLIHRRVQISHERINPVREAAGTPVWQRNYYDPIIRNERSLQHIRHYTTTNPLTWADDQLHPCNPSKW